MPTKEQENAAKVLAASMTPLEAAALVSANYGTYLKTQEDGKTHPMSRFILPDADWQAMKAHLTDGGGVVEDNELAVELMEALLADDQKTFWPSLVHLFKAWMRIRGHMVGAPGGGGMFFRGASNDDTVAP